VHVILILIVLGSIKIHDMHNLSDVYAIIPLEDSAGGPHSDLPTCLHPNQPMCHVLAGMLDRLAWSPDGQLLSISTMSGAVYTYLMKLPVLGAAIDHRVCYLSALTVG
jgi:hypothetical protein